MSEWGNERRGREYRNRWCQVSGSISIEYGNVEVYRKIPTRASDDKYRYRPG